MESIAYNRRYCPHILQNKFKAVQTYRSCRDIDYVCRKYHISKASLMRWNKKFDGSIQSLQNKSHRPLTPHPNSHTEIELNTNESIFKTSKQDTNASIKLVKSIRKKGRNNKKI